MNKNVISVGQLNLYVRTLIEGDSRLISLAICGEISNFKNHYSSGHWYFTLKDDIASIRCVMFRSATARVNFLPQDGIKVVLRGRVSLYEKDGQYQFYAEDMLPFGLGDINAEFERIKEKLNKEGLFDATQKRPLPKYPKSIAVVTSDTGAAVRDIFNILERRWPLCEVIMCPVTVQGDGAASSMIDALNRLYSLSRAEIIIIGRGGGSTEDLWAFNSEALARKIYESPVPVISAVGHETDFTIADFVADLRAPTPSAAAELAVPDMAEVSLRLSKYENTLRKSLGFRYNLALNRLNGLLNSVCFKNPVDFIITKHSQQIDTFCDSLEANINNILSNKNLTLAKLASRLDALSPLKVLGRGFALVSKNDEVINKVADLEAEDKISVRFSDGDAVCTVKELRSRK